MDLFSEDIKIDDLASAIRLFKESKEGFMRLFNNSPICMSMTTTTLGKRTYVRVNKKFLEKFEFTEAEIIGRSSAEIGILDQGESVRVGNIIKEKGRLHNDYVKCLNKSGNIIHTISSIEVMEMNEETLLVSFFVDVTKIMEQQAIIEQHVQQLEAVNKELEAFSYSVSHDLRAPIRAIDGYTKILEEDYKLLFDEEGKKILYIIQQNARKMGNLIDDLLSFARFGRTAIRSATLDMDQLVRDTLIEFKDIIRPETEIKMGTLHPAMGDHALIKQVLVNLISNALKYSSKKERSVVEIVSELKGDQVVYTIKDNGDGFEMQYVGKLFGVFQRLHKNEEFEGTGVGLAIVHRIISKHGGTVSAEAELGKSATFHFSLPALSK